jgi:hypothetical protein
LRLRVTDASCRASTLGCVVHHLADGALATDTAIGFGATRVRALVVDTRLIGRTVVVVTAASYAHTIETNVSTIAEGVAVTNRTTGAVDASRIRQTSLVVGTAGSAHGSDAFLVR